MFYAGIGSSKGVDQTDLNKLTFLAEQLNKKGYILRSGAAPCCDTAFEKGAGSLKEIFLPWKDFNGSTSDLYLDNLNKDDVNLAKRMAVTLYEKEFYKETHSKLHTRNIFQILGPTLSDPVEFVLAYTHHNPSVRKGGTCLGMNLARKMGIPVYNLYSQFDLIQFGLDYNIEIYDF